MKIVGRTTRQISEIRGRLAVPTPAWLRVSKQGSWWHGKALYGLYDRAHTAWEWYQEIFEHAEERALILSISAFNERPVDFFIEMGTPCIKIVSFENTDLPLIEVAAKTGEPLIILTGMASHDQIKAAIDTAQLVGCADLVLLKCTSTYPASAQDANRRTIPDLRRWARCEVGLSEYVGTGPGGRNQDGQWCLSCP